MDSEPSAKSNRVTRSLAKSLNEPIELKSPSSAKKSANEPVKTPVKKQRISLPNPKESKEPDKNESQTPIDKTTPKKLEKI